MPIHRVIVAIFTIVGVLVAGLMWWSGSVRSVDPSLTLFAIGLAWGFIALFGFLVWSFFDGLGARKKEEK